MKKTSFLLAITFAGLYACSTQQDLPTGADVAENKTYNQEKGIIPVEHPIMMMAMDPQKTWQDLHAYYTTELSNEQALGYYENLKNMAFSTLVTSKKMLDSAPQEVIEYYIQEQIAIPSAPFMQEFIGCLEKMRGKWSDATIKQIALKRFEDNKAYFNKDSKLAEAWPKIEARQAPLIHALK
jgi:hypothetical protein